MKKIILIILCSIILITVVVFVFKSKIQSSSTSSKVFSGMVYDCKTNLPIVDARVQILIDNDIFHFLSDSGRHYEGQSDNTGHFSISYGGGIGTVNVTKYDDYLGTAGTFMGGSTKIGLLKKEAKDSPTDYTIGCKKSAECTEVIRENGYNSIRTTCDMILPRT